MRNGDMRSRAKRTSPPVGLAVLFCLSLTSIVRGGDPPRPPSGEVRLGNGQIAEYTIHFDRNSLRDSVRLADSLIALTSSGTLLRFELPTLRLTKERIAAEDVTCLGRGEGERILVGLSDGRVCRVDPKTLDLIDVARLPSAPQWVGDHKAAGSRPAGVVAVTRKTKPVENDGELWEQSHSVVHDLGSGTTWAMEQEATTFLIDRAGRLWLGADMGEWGGWVARIDLAKGTAAEIPPPRARKPGGHPHWQGIYGLTELRDGQVWAFGGTSHMGFNQGFITRIDGAEPQSLLKVNSSQEPEKEPVRPQPRWPITHVVEERGGLLIVSYSDVFRVDQALKDWEKVTVLDLQYRWGRPNAVGSFPAVSALHPPRREGEPYWLATVGDGYVRLDGEKASSFALPGQLSASQIVEIKNTSEGPFFFESDDRPPLWRLGGKGWEIASLAPPLEADPANDVRDFENQNEEWYKTRVLVDPRGTIYTVSGTSVSPGTRTTARRVNHKSERLGRETSSLIPSASFLTADGTLWNVFFGEVQRFEKGRWRTVAHWPREECPSDLKSIRAIGPPWLLLDRDDHQLWQLETGAQEAPPRLSRMETREGGKPLRIDDAIPWSKGLLLLATDVGLRTYAPDTHRLARADLPEPEQPATTMICDGRGRLWMGGDHGLWLADAGARALVSLERVPWIGRNTVWGLAPDPDHNDGVIAALGTRGVAFLRAR